MEKEYLTFKPGTNILKQMFYLLRCRNSFCVPNMERYKNMKFASYYPGKKKKLNSYFQ